MNQKWKKHNFKCTVFRGSIAFIDTQSSLVGNQFVAIAIFQISFNMAWCKLMILKIVQIYVQRALILVLKATEWLSF